MPAARRTRGNPRCGPGRRRARPASRHRPRCATGRTRRSGWRSPGAGPAARRPRGRRCCTRGRRRSRVVRRRAARPVSRHVARQGGARRRCSPLHTPLLPQCSALGPPRGPVRSAPAATTRWYPVAAAGGGEPSESGPALASRRSCVGDNPRSPLMPAAATRPFRFAVQPFTASVRRRVDRVRPQGRGPRLQRPAPRRPLLRLRPDRAGDQAPGAGPRRHAGDGARRRRHLHPADRVSRLLRRLPRARRAGQGGRDARPPVRRAARARPRRRLDPRRVRRDGDRRSTRPRCASPGSKRRSPS